MQKYALAHITFSILHVQLLRLIEVTVLCTSLNCFVLNICVFTINAWLFVAFSQKNIGIDLR
jgi:hypothetical protein